MKASLAHSRCSLPQQQDDFHGTLNIKASILGLLNLFCLQDQQVFLLFLPCVARHGLV